MPEENNGEAANVLSPSRTGPRMMAFKPQGQRGPTVFRDMTGIATAHAASMSGFVYSEMQLAIGERAKREKGCVACKPKEAARAQSGHALMSRFIRTESHENPKNSEGVINQGFHATYFVSTTTRTFRLGELARHMLIPRPFNGTLLLGKDPGTDWPGKTDTEVFRLRTTDEDCTWVIIVRNDLPNVSHPSADVCEQVANAVLAGLRDGSIKSGDSLAVQLSDGTMLYFKVDMYFFNCVYKVSLLDGPLVWPLPGSSEHTFKAFGTGPLKKTGTTTEPDPVKEKIPKKVGLDGEPRRHFDFPAVNPGTKSKPSKWAGSDDKPKFEDSDARVLPSNGNPCPIYDFKTVYFDGEEVEIASTNEYINVSKLGGGAPTETQIKDAISAYSEKASIVRTTSLPNGFRDAVTQKAVDSLRFPCQNPCPVLSGTTKMVSGDFTKTTYKIRVLDGKPKQNATEADSWTIPIDVSLIAVLNGWAKLLVVCVE